MNPAIVRDIPSLYTLAIKLIAKAPAKCITEDSFTKAIQCIPTDMRDSLTQVILDAVIDAGRLTDDIFPVKCLDPLRNSLSLRNSKVTSGYIKKVITQVCRMTHDNKTLQASGMK